MEGYKSLEEKAVVEYEIEVDENTGKERAKNVVVVEAPAKQTITQKQFKLELLFFEKNYYIIEGEKNEQ